MRCRSVVGLRRWTVGSPLRWLGARRTEVSRGAKAALASGARQGAGTVPIGRLGQIERSAGLRGRGAPEALGGSYARPDMADLEPVMIKPGTMTDIEFLRLPQLTQRNHLYLYRTNSALLRPAARAKVEEQAKLEGRDIKDVTTCSVEVPDTNRS